MAKCPPTSVYIHFPYCVRKCAYCDFLSFPLCAEEKNEYIGALLSEIRLSPKWGAELLSRKEDIDAEEIPLAEKHFGDCVTEADRAGSSLKTIYFGGGTPSLMTPSQVEAVLRALRETFGIEEDCEITLEANPGTTDESKLLALREAGVNRLSLGIQSLEDPVLTTLGRIHDADAAKRAIRDARSAGFSNLSCDLMLGIPGQTIQSVKDTLAFLLAEDVPHISLYSLILEEGTPMYTRYGGDIEKYVTQEEDREMYHLVTETLGSCGFVHYEISNMARPGYESRHNLMYWRAENYYGLGVGAHYYLGNERGRHVETVAEYIAQMRNREIRRSDVWVTEEILSRKEQMKEYMMLGFRTKRGVEEKTFRERFSTPMDSAFGAELQRQIRAGLVTSEEGSYRLTEKGVDLANQVFMDYV
ncbi:MAG: radical SAM family heme chaperone HemW [Clostridiales bacterium]|nr:radical SAM family heme chaperone HemW [Clostridiales bacterium]